MKNHKRTYLDPIHQDITLSYNKPEERLIMELIDCREFQRLRRVQQLGISSLTFQGAEGSRFTHSVGAMYIARQLFEQLLEKDSGNHESFAHEKALVMASALLHDLGHGPFSHVTEKIVGYDHEDWSCRMIAGDTEVNRVLRSYKPVLHLAEDIVKVLKKTYAPKYISHLISSQLDCDRFDYLLRDSYMTGAAYGLFALNRIIASMELDEDADQIVVAGEKGKTAVEDYLFARYSMYAQVYYHKKNIAVQVLLTKLVNRTKYLLLSKQSDHCFTDEPMRKWLLGEPLTTQEYFFIDDVELYYHIKRWTNSPDKILSDLASRFLNRHLFKAVRIPSQHSIHSVEIEKEANNLASQHGLDPQYYVSLESAGFRPYDFYRPDSGSPQTNIMVRTETGEIRELSEISPPIEALVKGDFQSQWLIFPSEIKDKINTVINITSKVR